MRIISTGLIFFLTVLAGQARADSVTCADGSRSKAGRGACSYHGGVAKKRAPAPKRADRRTPTPTVRCNDGSTSSARGRGACSRHGGVESYERTKADRRADNDSPTNGWFPPASPGRGSVTARCADGTFSYSAHHTGTCSYHGGVAEWLTD